MGPAFAGLATLLVGLPSDVRAGSALLVALTFTLCQHVADRHAPNASFLPLVHSVYPLAGPFMGAAALCVMKATVVVPALEPLDIVLLSGAAMLGATLSRVSLPSRARQPRNVRVGIVGSAQTAADLAAELVRSGREGFTVVGFIPPESAQGQMVNGVTQIGSFGSIVQATAEHNIDLLLLSTEVPRLAAFNELANHSLGSTLRVIELPSFYEEVFGHVALTAINASWFQWVLHPSYSPKISPTKRALDLLIASAAFLAFGPVLAILALLIRMDGGSVLYRQLRIGEGGTEFEILKLRSMRTSTVEASPQWSSSDDHRVTRIGSFIRRTHLDELPQVVNVLRGEMSIVGPRPEQPCFVDRLEQVIPFYSRRHLVRPGITGWAQVHCGYGGSEAGSALKACHDLYYLKHRSIAFDLLIIGETIRTLLAPHQWTAPPPERRFVLPATVRPEGIEPVPHPELEPSLSPAPQEA